MKEITNNRDNPLDDENFKYHHERARVISNEFLQKGWIDQEEVDKIMKMASEDPVEAGHYNEQRRSNYAYFGTLLDENIITNEIANELIKMDPYEAYEKIMEYEKQLDDKRKREK